MNFPTLSVGITDPVRDALIAEAVQGGGIKLAQETFPKLSERTIKRAVQRHNTRNEYDLFIESPDGTRVRVCHVVTDKDFPQVCIKAFRAYKATLQRLEIPGWTLTNGLQRIECTTLQRAIVRSAGVPGMERALARKQLGMRHAVVA